MGPFTPLFSSGVPVAVMCCKVFPQKNLCCMVSLWPFKKSALVGTIFAFGVLLFFRLLLATSFGLFFLLLLWGWERWLSDSTFLLWTDSDDCCFAGCLSFFFRDDSSSRRSPSTSASRRGFPRRFRVFLFFRCFRVLWSSGLNGVSVRFLCRPFRVWCFPLGVGWGVLGVFFFSPLPPPPPPPPCVSLASCIYSSN